jgi:hypothetical protein
VVWYFDRVPGSVGEFRLGHSVVCFPSFMGWVCRKWVMYDTAVESVHKSSDSDFSISKTSDSDSSIFKSPTPIPTPS